MGGPLNEEEAHVIQGVLDLSSKTGFKAMTPLEKVGERRASFQPSAQAPGSCAWLVRNRRELYGASCFLQLEGVAPGPTVSVGLHSTTPGRWSEMSCCCCCCCCCRCSC